MASASSANEVLLFIETSLGTNIVISVSPDLTAAEVKRKLESMHSNCFPGIGDIKFDGTLKVKRKSKLYHLPDWLPIRHAFQGSKRKKKVRKNSKPRVPKYAPNTPPATTIVRASKKSSGVGKRLSLRLVRRFFS